MNDIKILDRNEGLEKIYELIKSIHICTMTTLAEDGSLDSRPMASHLELPFTGTLWFLTRDSSGKVGEVQDDAHVTLAYVDTSHENFVTLKGRASVSKDKAKIHDLWNPIYKGHIVMGPLADNSVQALLDLLWDQEGSLAAAEKKFDQLIPNVKAFLNTTPELESAISSGDAWVALLNESRAGIDKENGAPVEFVVPKPGAVVDWLLGIDVPANAPNKAAAYAFINFLLQPAQQSKIADAGFFSPINPKATYSDRIKALSETPPGAKKGHVTNWKRITDNYNDLNKWWTSEVGG